MPPGAGLARGLVRRGCTCDAGGHERMSPAKEVVAGVRTLMWKLMAGKR